MKPNSGNPSLLVMLHVFFFALVIVLPARAQGSGDAAIQEATGSFQWSRQFIEACECAAPCPCIYKNPATHDRCRVVQAYHIENGTLGEVDLVGQVFSVVVTHAPKQMTEGGWTGLIYLPDAATESQRSALLHLARNVMGGKTAKWEVLVAQLRWEQEGNAREFWLGDFGHVKSHPLLEADGKWKTFTGAPFALSGTMNAGVAAVHTYRDAEHEWNLAGRNVWWGPIARKFTEKPAKAAK